MFEKGAKDLADLNFPETQCWRCPLDEAMPPAKSLPPMLVRRD